MCEQPGNGMETLVSGQDKLSLLSAERHLRSSQPNGAVCALEGGRSWLRSRAGFAIPLSAAFRSHRPIIKGGTDLLTQCKLTGLGPPGSAYTSARHGSGIADTGVYHDKPRAARPLSGASSEPLDCQEINGPSR